MSDEPSGGEGGGLEEPDPDYIFTVPNVGPSVALRGDAINAMRSFIEEHLRPMAASIVDPISGTTALALITKDGLEPVPASIFDDYLEYPRSRRGSAGLTSLASFIDHVNRFKSDNTVIFARDNREQPSLTAVLDYHAAGHASQASHGRHRSTFAFPLSDEWKAWQKRDNDKMTMADFAMFLEDRIIDVDSPDSDLGEDIAKLVRTLGGARELASPTKLIELSRGLQVHEASAVREAVKLSSGAGEISFQSEHLDALGEQLSVPSMFLLAIPVFRNGAPYQVLARLRYRKTPSGLVFWYELSRTDRVFDHAFDEAVAEVIEKTTLPVLLGSPEA
jgi:hypothetical protein